MTIIEAVNIFRVLYGDRYGDTSVVGFMDHEVSRLFNMAQVMVMEERFFNHRQKRKDTEVPRYGWENTQWDSEAFQGLVCTFDLPTDATTGCILEEAALDLLPIEGIYAWDTSTGIPERKLVETRHTPIFHTNYLKVGSSFARYRRLNDCGRLAENSFKRATTDKPWVLYVTDKATKKKCWKILPIMDITVELCLTRLPQQVWYNEVSPTENIDFDAALPDWVLVDWILPKAVELAVINAGGKG